MSEFHKDIFEYFKGGTRQCISGAGRAVKRHYDNQEQESHHGMVDEMVYWLQELNQACHDKDAEIERLRAALKFYADPESYDRHVTNIDEHGCDYSTRPVVEDDGERARKALGVQDTKEDE